MHDVRHDVVEQALIVGDDDRGALRRAQPVDAVGDDLQGVDVEAGVGLVEDREPRLQQRHLQNLIALLLAAREAHIDGAAQHLRADRELGGALAHALEEFRRGQLRLAALLALRVERGAQERHGGDAGDFDRILEGEEEALGGALVGIEVEHVLAVEQDLPLRHLVVGLAGEHIGERRLARSVRAHDRVHLALVHREIEAVQDLLAVDFDVQVFDFKQRHYFVLSLVHFMDRHPEVRGQRPSLEGWRHRTRRRPSRFASRAPQGDGFDYPTLPSRLTEISFCASTANSIGNCCSTSFTKPLTTSAVASSAVRPR